jgi:single-stranded DNA-binding protein
MAYVGFVHASVLVRDWKNEMERRMHAMNDKQEESDRSQPGEKPAFPLINEAHVVGRLTNTVTGKDYGEGKKRAQFSIAVPRGGRKKEGQPDVDFITITAWGALATQCEGLSKGDALDIQGRLRTWKDETDRYHWGITADQLQVLYRQPPKGAKGTQQQELAGV